MIIRRTDMRRETRTAMRGGPGAVDLTILSDKPCRNCRLLADITIAPGSGIGEHDHKAETEYYIIASGVGIVRDHGIDTEVGAGDLVVTGGGASHSISNTGSEPLRMYAVIITE